MRRGKGFAGVSVPCAPPPRRSHAAGSAINCTAVSETIPRESDPKMGGEGFFRQSVSEWLDENVLVAERGAVVLEADGAIVLFAPVHCERVQGLFAV